MALGALCVAAAAACGCHALAQEADDDAEDDDGELVVEAEPSRWSVLLEPVTSARSSLNFLSGGGMPDRAVYFTSFDIWRYGWGVHTGLQWAPNTVNRDGFILRLTGSESFERFSTRRRNYENHVFRGAVMPGLRFKFGNLEMQMLSGPDLEADFQLINRRLTAYRRKIGVRFAVDIWAEPTRALMLQTSLSGTTIDNAFSTRLAAGWRLFDRFWVGPETSFSRDFFSRQRRVGAHITGLRTDAYEWSLAVGYIKDSVQRDGVYGRLGLVIRPPREAFFEN
jgi:hypothetical protein